MSSSSPILVSVYLHKNAATILYDLLAERTAEQSISHVAFPTWKEHCTFIDSLPYRVWYLILVGNECVGSIYLSKQQEIGVFIFRTHQQKGYGKAAVTLLMEQHPDKFLANINPANTPSIKMFESLGFTHIQNTYKGPTGNPYERE